MFIKTDINNTIIVTSSHVNIKNDWIEVEDLDGEIMLGLDKFFDGVVVKASPEVISQHAHQVRIQGEKENAKQKRIAELKHTLSAYTEDFAQAAAGLYIADLELRKEKFRQAHAELRQLASKEPRLFGVHK